VLSITRSGGELVVSYGSAGSFWTIQLLQDGLYLVVAAAALATAVWLPHRRAT
jgi:hypothetical protein